jgi:5-methylcytosine-specific restriction enzyme A
VRTNGCDSGWEWREVQQATLARNRRDNDGQCQRQFDGCLGAATEVNHIIPRIDGGGDEPFNLEALCAGCHYRLTTTLVQERAAMRRATKKSAKRRNHPGRKDRHDC